MNNPAFIETRHLKKYFKTPKGSLHAVDDIDLTIAKGETLGVVGESGCGKSTLGKTILRLYDVTEGEILCEGKNIANCGKHELKAARKKMQMIFQDPYSSLNSRMSVEELIAAPLLVNDICPRNEVYSQEAKDRYFNCLANEENISIRQAYQAGLKLGFGTDIDIVELSENMGCEFLACKKYTGMSNRDMLLQATRNNAQILRIDDLTGSVTEGLSTDLILVDGDPGRWLFGAVLTCTGLTTSMGASYTSVSFLKIFHPVVQRFERLCTVCFALIAAGVAYLWGTPTDLMLLAGLLNGAVLSVMLTITLLAEQKPAIVGEDFHMHPLLRLAGIPVTLVASFACVLKLVVLIRGRLT